MARDSRSIIEKVAQRANVSLSKKKYTLLILFASIIPIIAVYIPRYINSYCEHQKAVDIAKAAYSEIEIILRDGNQEDHVISTRDPKDGYCEDGYNITWCHYYSDSSTRGTDMAINISNAGTIDGISYRIDIDVTLSKEENLARIESAVNAFNEKLAKITVPTEHESLLQKIVIPNTVIQKFSETSYYQGFQENANNMRITYYTTPEDEYHEYSSSYIRISMLTEEGRR